MRIVRTSFLIMGILLAFLIIPLGCALRLGSPSKLNDAPAPTTIPFNAKSQSTSYPGLIAPQKHITLPPGFNIAVFAQGISQPRMMTLSSDGILYVAERGAGRIIRLPDKDGDGNADAIQVVSDGLNSPTSLAFYQDGSLFVGETNRILRLSNQNSEGVFLEEEVVIENLPGGGHNTRTVLFSPDWQTLFVSIGSSCNVCEENDERRATIMRYSPQGLEEKIFATGLRNAVGLTIRPGTNELWATNNGRDMLGDDLPPDTIYLIREDRNYGWPYCHSGRLIDPQFGDENACQGVESPEVEMQAHSAPLGLTFYNGNQFPEEYHQDMFVAFHGSWNRSVPTGYKIVHIPFVDGKPGAVMDFAIGWLEGETFWGRPVDVITGVDGSLFVSDDAGGIIYRIFYSGT